MVFQHDCAPGALHSEQWLCQFSRHTDRDRSRVRVATWQRAEQLRAFARLQTHELPASLPTTRLHGPQSSGARNLLMSRIETTSIGFLSTETGT